MFKNMSIYRITDRWQGGLQALEDAIFDEFGTTPPAGHRRAVSSTAL